MEHVKPLVKFVKYNIFISTKTHLVQKIVSDFVRRNVFPVLLYFICVCVYDINTFNNAINYESELYHVCNSLILKLLYIYVRIIRDESFNERTSQPLEGFLGVC